MSNSTTQNQIITIQCRLKAPESTLRYIWQSMAYTTELINSLLYYINTHPDFGLWLSEKRKIPADLINSFIKAEKSKLPYEELPGSFIDSAKQLVKEMFLSWFEIYFRKSLSLQGKQRFLNILKSDEDLQEQSKRDFEFICKRAKKILEKIKLEIEKKHRTGKLPVPTNEKQAYWQLANYLYEAYDQAKTSLSRCAIALLLKNRNEVPEQLEDPEKFKIRHEAKKEEIRSLKLQLQAKTPKGRQIGEEEWLSVLDTAREPITEEQEFIDIQAQILRKFSEIVYPVVFDTNTDLRWLMNEEGRICVRFKGLGSKTFEINCDKRQLPWFQKFLADYQIYEKEQKKVPTGLMPLRCGRLVWTEGEDHFASMFRKALLLTLLQHKIYFIVILLLKNPKIVKSNPWNIHHLHLHCNVDAQLWTQEGKEIVKAQKIIETEKSIKNYEEKEKEQENGLDDNQKKRLKANRTSLALLLEKDTCLVTSQKISYKGQINRILAVSIGLHDPVTIIIVDTTTGKELAVRTTKQLLGKKRRVKAKQPKVSKYEDRPNLTIYKEVSDYDLLLSYREQKKRNQHKRHKAQIRGASAQLGESNLGLYINRLFAKSIVELAKEYQVGILILPDLENKKEVIKNEIIARAKLKIPKNKRLQKQYTREIMMKVSEWSYAQLNECILNKASQSGINVEFVKQVTEGSHREKAQNMIATFMKKFKDSNTIETT